MALSVPQPAVTQTGASGGALSAAGAITITCGPVKFADGSALTAKQATQSTYLLYRRPSGGPLQAWDTASKTWQGASPAPAGQALFLKDGTWTGVLVPVGQKDAGGDPLLDPALSASYSVACQFAGTDAAGGTESGASSPSAAFTVQAPGAANRAGLTVDPQDPTAATLVQMFLKDSSLQTRATVTLSSAGGYAVTLVAGTASVALTQDGSISLSAAGSEGVQISGDLSITGRLYVNGTLVA